MKYEDIISFEGFLASCGTTLDLFIQHIEEKPKISFSGESKARRTVRQWLRLNPDATINDFIEKIYLKDASIYPVDNFISSGFIWATTPESHSFWMQISKNWSIFCGLKNMSFPQTGEIPIFNKESIKKRKENYKIQEKQSEESFDEI